MSKVSNNFCCSSYKIFYSEDHEENNSKRKKLNPSTMLETIEEKYEEIINDKRKIKNENTSLLDQNRGLVREVDDANCDLRDAEEKLTKFTGKTSHDLSKIFVIENLNFFKKLWKIIRLAY